MPDVADDSLTFSALFGFMAVLTDLPGVFLREPKLYHLALDCKSFPGGLVSTANFETHRLRTMRTGWPSENQKGSENKLWV